MQVETWELNELESELNVSCNPWLMTNAIGGAHCTIQNHKKYKIVKTKKKHRVVELQQYTDYDFEPYLMRWFTVFG